MWGADSGIVLATSFTRYVTTMGAIEDLLSSILAELTELGHDLHLAGHSAADSGLHLWTRDDLAAYLRCSYRLIAIRAESVDSATGRITVVR
jgi:hypothetical protein